MTADNKKAYDFLNGLPHEETSYDNAWYSPEYNYVTKLFKFKCDVCGSTSFELYFPHENFGTWAKCQCGKWYSI